MSTPRQDDPDRRRDTEPARRKRRPEGPAEPPSQTVSFNGPTSDTGTYPTADRLLGLSAGRYRIEEEIAQGGMGTIYRARDNFLGRELALKVLLPDHAHSADLRQRFLDEARITARLQHPSIVPVYDIGELPDGLPFFAMWLIDGQSLAAWLAERQGPGRELPRFLKVFEQACQALAYAHSVGVVHRDLKPANIMVAEFGAVKVMDWGLAKELGAAEQASPPALYQPRQDTATQIGHVMGTPAYMAPEQARGEPVDERADVFGLGAILCEGLTGQPPFPANDNHQAHRLARRGDLDDALARLARAPAEQEVVELALRCLAPDVADRPANAGAVAHSVTTFLESHLRRAESDLERFFELSLDLFCLAGLDGHFRRVNPNFSRVLGHPTEELLSRPFLDFVHPDDRDRTVAEVEKLAKGLPVVRFRNRYRAVRGDYHWFEWTAKSVPSEGVIYAVARDVTDQVDLEEQLFRP